MKTSELLSRLDLLKKEEYNIEDLLGEFNIDSFDVDYDKIKLYCIRIVTWFCTDSWVGILVVLLDDTPVCISRQIGRKWDEEFEWVSKEAYLKTKEVVEKARIIREKNINILDMDREFGESYKIDYPEQLILSIPNIHTPALFNGESVSVEKIKSTKYLEENVRIICNNGDSQIVPLEELDFPLLGLKDV